MIKMKPPSLEINVYILTSPRFKDDLPSEGSIRLYEKAAIKFLLTALDGYDWSPETSRTSRAWRRLPFKVGRIGARNANHNVRIVAALTDADKAGRKAAGLEE